MARSFARSIGMAIFATLNATIAARQPFLDFIFTRIETNGSQRSFRVSGEPMFNSSCRLTGYRGVGAELLVKT